jgi:hypothetical protein
MLANVEARSSTSSGGTTIIVLEVVAAHVTTGRKETRTSTRLATARSSSMAAGSTAGRPWPPSFRRSLAAHLSPSGPDGPGAA